MSVNSLTAENVFNVKWNVTICFWRINPTMLAVCHDFSESSLRWFPNCRLARLNSIAHSFDISVVVDQTEALIQTFLFVSRIRYFSHKFIFMTFQGLIKSSISAIVFGHSVDKTLQLNLLLSVVMRTSSSIRTPIPANSDRFDGRILLDLGM